MDEFDYVRAIGKDLDEPSEPSRARVRAALMAAVEAEGAGSGNADRSRPRNRAWRRARILLIAAGALLVPTAGFALTQSGDRPVQAAACPEANDALRDAGFEPPTEYAECPDPTALDDLKPTLERLQEKRSEIDSGSP